MLDNGRIKLTWTPPPANGSPITVYKIRWNEGSGNTTWLPSNVFEVAAPATEFIFQAPDSGVYNFQILAENSVGVPMTMDVPPVPDYSPPAPATETIVTLAAPPDDTVTIAIDDDGVATLTWNPIIDDNHELVRYDLQYMTTATDAQPVWTSEDDVTEVEQAAQAFMQHVTEPLPGGMLLHVQLRIVTSIGYTSEYAPQQQGNGAVRTIGARAPGLPVVEVSVISSSAIVSWDAPEPNGDDIVEYQLQFKKDDGDFGDHDGADDTTLNEAADPDTNDNDYVTIPHVAETTSYSHYQENLDGDAIYAFRVRAVNGCNDADDLDDSACGGTDSDAAVTGSDRTWSVAVPAQTGPGPTADPVLPATPVLTVDADDEDGEIDVSWPEVDEDSTITGYELQRWNASTRTWDDIPANLGATDTEYVDTNVELGETYYYAIRALSAAGMSAWTQQPFPNDKLFAKAPDTPVVTPSVDGQDITLSWTVPADNGESIVSYEINSTAAVADDGEWRPP